MYSVGMRRNSYYDITDARAWLPGVRKCYSPNFDERPADAEVELLVVHNISLPPNQFGTGCIEQFFCNALDPGQHSYFRTIDTLKVSSHYLIDRSGACTQFVSNLNRAWHAGVSSFEGRERCNDFSIGIELEGADLIPYTQAQYLSLARLCNQIISLFPAAGKNRIVGHSDIAPGRKTDPGDAFDWRYFAKLLAQEPAERS